MLHSSCCTSCCIPPTSLLHLSLLLHPSYIHCIPPPLHPFLPGSHCPRLNPGRRILCQGEGPGGTTVPGAGSEGRGTNLHPSSSRLWGAETAQGRVSCCLWQHLGDCCLVQELILKSRTSNNPLQSHFPRVFCVQNSDTMTAALVSKSSPEPGTTWTSQIPAIPKPILSLQQDFYIFFSL